MNEVILGLTSIKICKIALLMSFYKFSLYKMAGLVNYLDKLKEYAKKYKVAIHSYVLMTNHTHLLMTPETQTGVSQLMQSLGGITLDILIKLIIVRAHSGKVVINQR